MRDRKQTFGCQGLEARGNGSEHNKYEVSFPGDKIIWNSTLMMVAQCSVYTKNHSVVQFEMMNFIVCELDLSNIVLKKEVI